MKFWNVQLLLMDQQSLTNIGLDMVMVMKVTLLVTELFFVFLLSWINYLKSTWALHQTKGAQKADGSQTCWNTCG